MFEALHPSDFTRYGIFVILYGLTFFFVVKEPFLRRLGLIYIILVIVGFACFYYPALSHTYLHRQATDLQRLYHVVSYGNLALSLPITAMVFYHLLNSKRLRNLGETKQLLSLLGLSTLILVALGVQYVVFILTFYGFAS